MNFLLDITRYAGAGKNTLPHDSTRGVPPSMTIFFWCLLIGITIWLWWIIKKKTN